MCIRDSCTIMNGDMRPAERDKVVMNFRLGRIWVLITTELLARGIDFKNVGTVINYDFPTTKESYVHRIGRTGRAVSYTHLRAHETPEHLVCRLLLEKKKRTY
eukprot:TRINITY_DN54663_c0_g1_i1.p1 TRINITY_DN54663_c0_g1~~TRINITY_DN54663_c0_g1_i1.p1  ORF type:complete len:103 (-),score=32.16 TRINITY_DN54663_c0_g1_i1:39-347(-)